MELSEKIVALLELAERPLGVDVMAMVLAPGRDVEVRAAMFDLLVGGTVVIDQQGAVSLVAKPEAPEVPVDSASQPQPQQVVDPIPASMEVPTPDSPSSPVSEPEPEPALEAEPEPEPEPEQSPEAEPEPEPEPKPEPAPEPEPKPVRHIALTDDYVRPELPDYLSRPYDDDLPPWPWPELTQPLATEPPAAEPSATEHEIIAGMLEHLDAGDDAQGEPQPAQRTPLYRDTPLDALSFTTALKNKLQRCSITNVAELVAQLDSLEDIGLTFYMATNARDALAEACDCTLELESRDQAIVATYLSGCRSYGFDMFGRLCRIGQEAGARSWSAELGQFESSLATLHKLIEDEEALRELRLGRLGILGQGEETGDQSSLSTSGIGSDVLGDVRSAIGGMGLAAVQSAISAPSSDAFKALAHKYDDATLMVAYALVTLDPSGWLFWEDMFLVTMLPLAQETLASHPDNPRATFMEQLWAQKGFAQSCAVAIKDALTLRDDVQKGLKGGTLSVSSEQEIERMLRETVEAVGLDYDSVEGRIALHTPSLGEWLSTLPEHERHLLERRISGATLEETGNELGITKERVRQVQTKILDSRPPLQEDSYAHLVDAYELSSEQFCAMTGLDEKALAFYNLVSTTRKMDRLPLLDALDDPEVPESAREALLAMPIDDGKIQVGEQRVPRTRLDIVKALLPTDDEGSIEDVTRLWERYCEFLRDNDLEGSKSLTFPNERAFEAWVMRQPGLLYVPTPKSMEMGGRYVRLFNVEQEQLDRLVEYLESGEFFDIDCSAALVFGSESFAPLREELDIRNEYELHSVVRNYCGAVNGLVLGRTPTMVFGKGSRRKQLLELIRGLGPVSAADLCRAYQEAYGVDATVVQGSYLQEVADCKAGGYYTIKPYK